MSSARFANAVLDNIEASISLGISEHDVDLDPEVEATLEDSEAVTNLIANGLDKDIRCTLRSPTIVENVRVV